MDCHFGSDCVALYHSTTGKMESCEVFHNDVLSDVGCSADNLVDVETER